jgi:hypothetical protein
MAVQTGTARRVQGVQSGKPRHSAAGGITQYYQYYHQAMRLVRYGEASHGRLLALRYGLLDSILAPVPR